VQKAERRRIERMDSDFSSRLRKQRNLEHDRSRERRRAESRRKDDLESAERAADKQREFESGYDDEDPEHGDARHYRDVYVAKQRKIRQSERDGWEAEDRALELQENGGSSAHPEPDTAPSTAAATAAVDAVMSPVVAHAAAVAADVPRGAVAGGVGAAGVFSAGSSPNIVGARPLSVTNKRQAAPVAAANVFSPSDDEEEEKEKEAKR
jgi:hypothetical protein